MASPKLRLDLQPPVRPEGLSPLAQMPAWTDDDLENKLRDFLVAASVPYSDIKVLRYPDTGVVKGQVYITLAEGANAPIEAEKLDRAEFEGRRMLAQVAEPIAKREDALPKLNPEIPSNPGEHEGPPRI